MKKLLVPIVIVVVALAAWAYLRNPSVSPQNNGTTESASFDTNDNLDQALEDLNAINQ